MPYISNTEEQVKEMFKQLNIKSFDDLVVDIPKSIRLKGDYNISSGLSELEVKEKLDYVTNQNKPITLNHCFLGGGFEYHYIPPVVKQMIMRSEFYTAYTPYQPEISQGMLQAIFEYQTYICMLTGMDVANASGYDGGTCTVDATIMAIKQTNSKKVMFANTMNPEYIRVFDTYNIGMQAEKDFIPVSQDFSIDFKALEDKLSKAHYSCVVVQMPNYFGYVEEYSKISELCKKYKSLFVVVLEPFSVGLLKTPGELGADIVVGEGQSLGCPVYLGGATIGFLAAKKDLMRLVPGRIVGQTTADGGKTAYVLTLQTREQHIRREKASSNICSNQALLALMVTIYLSAMEKMVSMILLKHLSTMLIMHMINFLKTIKLNLCFHQNHFLTSS